MQKSYMEKQKDAAAKAEWLLVDIAGLPMGRACARIAAILRGKHKPTFTPNVDTGDYVVVINSDKVILTGNKMTDKYYFSYSGYISGDKHVQAKHMLEQKSDFAVMRTVKGMLPKNSLGRAMIKKLKVYKDGKHPHEAQNPREINIMGVK